jgi:hypothetical protein
MRCYEMQYAECRMQMMTGRYAQNDDEGGKKMQDECRE